MNRNLAFYTIAHASKFVRPGSYRIASESSTRGSLPNVAFSTPNKQTVLLVANPGHDEQVFRVKFHGKTYATKLAAGDVATYIWR